MFRWEQACTYWDRVIPTKIDIYFSDPYQICVLEIFGSVISESPFLGFLLQTILVMADNDKWGYFALKVCYKLKCNYYYA